MKKKTKLILSIASLLIFSTYSQAQTIYFQEDFETDPTTSVVNTFTDSVPNGPSPCSQASRGTTADFNSSNVDFKNAQNATYFLGVNPEAPCGGYYDATLASDTMDWSAADSLLLECRYFQSTTLMWGPTILSVIVSNGSVADTTLGVFSTNDSWANAQYILRTALAGPNVVMTIRIGGGEGVGLDDISVKDYSTSTPSSISAGSSLGHIKLYPNPVKDVVYIDMKEDHSGSLLRITDMYGRKVQEQNIQHTERPSINVVELAAGSYILQLIDTDGHTTTRKILKQ